MKIEFVKNKDIDIKKWDQTINNSENGLIYGYSWFLDIMTENWDALIAGDYEYILPLPNKKRFLLNIIYQPFYTQKFNIFTKNNLDEKIYTDFINNIPKKFSMVNLNIDFNKELNIKNYNFFIKQTQELFIEKDINFVYQNISKPHLRNIKKAEKFNVKVIESKHVANPVLMKKFIHLRNRIKPPDDSYDRLTQFFTECIKRNSGIIYDAYYNDELCASAFFAKFRNRYIIHSGSNDTGRKTSASFLLVKKFIDDFYEQNVILDFAGSNIKSILEWNLGFGAKMFNFYSLSKINIISKLKSHL